MSDDQSHTLTFHLTGHRRRIPQFDFSQATIQICRRTKRWLAMMSNDGSITTISQAEYPPIINQFQIRCPGLFHPQSLQQHVRRMLSTMQFGTDVLQEVEQRISRYLLETTQVAIDLEQNSLDIAVDVEDFWVQLIGEDEVINGVLGDSTENVGFGAVPAPRTSIDALQSEVFNGRNCGGDCSVCLDELRDGMKVIKLLCCHVFHADCIKQWLEQSNSCPLCRAKI